MQKKILYITYDGLTDPLGQSQILPYLMHLARRGYLFTILSFEKRNRFDKEGQLIQEIVNKAGIEWIPLTFTAKPPVLSKVYDRYRMSRTALSLHRQKNFDLVHCRSYIAAEVGLLLKRRFGVKMLFDMRGFWADEKVDNGQWNLKHPLFNRIYRHYKQKEKDFLLNADGIISLTQAAKAYLKQQQEYRNLSIEVIPCCADLHHFDYTKVDPLSVDSLRVELGIPANTKVITYLGSVGGWYMTKEMFQFFNILQQRQPEYKMLILTKDDPEVVKQEAAAQGIPTEKLIVTYSDRKRLPVFLALCDWSIFFIRNTFSKTASSPTKHAELMGMGIPVVCNTIGDTGNIIKTTATGLLVDDFSRVTFEKACGEMAHFDKMDKKVIRHFAKEYFDLEMGAENYLRLYRRILENELTGSRVHEFTNQV
ncbi:glycosyltransferase [Chitinophagaceae bacterium LB-8]|uniref:Glycosyltransferase n=1 Tax=Paraflavisolibacter caeni TaxID=2982496 RepID=A0A9X2XYS8_9BACT|nr:glycosyltransferase [Paraflavisolibacter caeni]MCU7551305.1 glycosyltransferase [Paraflavisolibacter caeni]